MKEGDSFSVPEVYEVRYRQSLDKQEQKLIVQYFWMKFWEREWIEIIA
jgi:hypothetical protein